MADGRSQLDPIQWMDTFTEKVVPSPAIANMVESFEGKTRCQNDPIPFQTEYDAIVASPKLMVSSGELQAVFVEKLREIVSSNSSSLDSIVLSSWLEGRNLHNVADQLNWMSDAVRQARKDLVKRLRVSIAPPGA